MSPPVTMMKRLYPLWFMLGVTLLFMSAVTGAHLGTKEAVDRNQSLYIKRAVLAAAGLQVPLGNKDVETLFQQKAVSAGDSKSIAFDVTADESSVRVMQVTGTGLWGEIGATVGLKPDGTLSGIAFTSQNETPGLGARIQEAWFMAQFRGKKPPLTLVAEGTKSSAPSEIDAITGASITSKAVRDMVNLAAAGPEGDTRHAK
jgi:Na+-transporting NADH:ubiquinone oxidoreductase subunit C